MMTGVVLTLTPHLQRLVMPGVVLTLTPHVQRLGINHAGVGDDWCGSNMDPLCSQIAR